MSLYGLLLIAATASAIPFGGGGSLLGARFPGPEEHPGAVIWQPNYLLISGLSRRLPHPDVDLELTAADPGQGLIGASAGFRYRYHGSERHLISGSGSTGIRLGSGIGFGLGATYDPEQSIFETLRWGMSYAAWPRPSGAGRQPGLILAIDNDSSRLGDSRWRLGAVLQPLQSLRAAWDHRFDGSNHGALQFRLGAIELLSGFELSSNYDFDQIGAGLRWHDRAGWLGISWARQGADHQLALELTVPIGARAQASR